MKKKIGNQNVLYPTPVTIVGALVNGKIIMQRWIRIKSTDLVGGFYQTAVLLRRDDDN
jgi:hypothetical protein